MSDRPTAAPLLTCRSVDHLAYTVPDLDAAVAFFRDVLGAKEIYRSAGPDEKNAATFAERFNTHRDAGYRLSKLTLGGAMFELFEYSAPDLARTMPRNCDAGGGHFAVAVDDVPAAAEMLRSQPGVRVLGQPSEIGPGHPLAGRHWVYFLTPWGLQIELVSSNNCDTQ
ncbi:MAG TPA: VOC family protein [Alphaproteobacteria bacterium]|jgi:catechol 2,3-dioxygenase-like lactoylglutathione lyase family enzyme|nr:VOC family protein [Alphaproteobacteria bacterium]